MAERQIVFYRNVANRGDDLQPEPVVFRISQIQITAGNMIPVQGVHCGRRSTAGALKAEEYQVEIFGVLGNRVFREMKMALK
jgi:hypothetical protein